MTNLLHKFWNDESGQDIIEYTLLLIFIAVACMWFLGYGHGSVVGIWTSANTSLASGVRAANGG